MYRVKWLSNMDTGTAMTRDLETMPVYALKAVIVQTPHLNRGTVQQT
jgi:hypothetical protein